MRKTKEKEVNGTKQKSAASKVKRTDDSSNDEFIMLPTVDFCFKELMHNENVRKGIIMYWFREMINTTGVFHSVIQRQERNIPT